VNTTGSRKGNATNPTREDIHGNGYPSLAGLVVVLQFVNEVEVFIFYYLRDFYTV
jgi:hypothetical protein